MRQGVLLLLLVAILYMQVVSLDTTLVKKAVFDIIPRLKTVNKYENYKARKTHEQLQKTLRNLWTQYNGNWLGKMGKITLINKFVEKNVIKNL